LAFPCSGAFDPFFFLSPRPVFSFSSVCGAERPRCGVHWTFPPLTLFPPVFFVKNARLELPLPSLSRLPLSSYSLMPVLRCVRKHVIRPLRRFPPFSNAFFSPPFRLSTPPSWVLCSLCSTGSSCQPHALSLPSRR